MLPKEFDPHAMPVYLPEISDTESATDCTGLIPRGLRGLDEEESYLQLYSTSLPGEPESGKE